MFDRACDIPIDGDSPFLKYGYSEHCILSVGIRRNRVRVVTRLMKSLFVGVSKYTFAQTCEFAASFSQTLFPGPSVPQSRL